MNLRGPPADALRDVKRPHEAPLTAIAASPDGRRVATASGGKHEERTLRVWDAALTTEVGRLDLAPLGDWVTSLTWSKDGRRVFAGTSRGVILEVEVEAQR